MIRVGRRYSPEEVLPFVIFEPKAHGALAERLGFKRDYDGDKINMASLRLRPSPRGGSFPCGISDNLIHWTLHILRDDLAKAIRLLREREWSGWSQESEVSKVEHFCQYCFAPAESKKHNDGCDLAELLDKYPEKKP